MMIEHMEIRPLGKEDIDEVVRIHHVITGKPTPAVVRELLRKSLDDRSSAAFVAVLDGHVVGFMMGVFKRGAFGLDHSFWIEMMGVDPKYMGSGIGQAIGTKVFEFCKDQGVHDVYTTVRWDSVDLLSFFKTLGFDRSNFINLKKSLQ